MPTAVIQKPYTEAEVAALVCRAELLIGKRLDRLIDRHANATRTGTRREHPHRLIEVLLRLRAVAGLTEGLLVGAAAVNAVELNAALDLYDTWANHQAWPDFQRALRSPHEYLHAVATLSVASMLRVHHRNVELVVATAADRTPDLRLVIPDESGLDVEVKAPPALWQRDAALDLQTARRMVRSCLGSAGGGAGGQLGRRPGILVVAGFHLSDDTFEVLTRGTDLVLRSLDPRNTSLLGIALFNLRVRVEAEGDTIHVLLEEVSRLGRSPTYSGRLTLQGDWGSTWHLLPT
jgi:hypothetical protein